MLPVPLLILSLDNNQTVIYLICRKILLYSIKAHKFNYRTHWKQSQPSSPVFSVKKNRKQRMCKILKRCHPYGKVKAALNHEIGTTQMGPFQSCESLGE